MSEVKLSPWTYVYEHPGFNGPFWSHEQHWNGHTSTTSMPLYFGADVWALSAKLTETQQALRESERLCAARNVTIGELGQRVAKLEAAITAALEVWSRCYDCTEHPANGRSDQDEGIAALSGAGSK